MVDPELLAIMPFQVTLRPPVTMNSAGERTWGDPLLNAKGELPYCRIEPGMRLIPGDPGNTEYAVGTIYLQDTYSVLSSWSVELPEDAPLYGEMVYIARVMQETDENGPYSTTLYLGSTTGK